MHRRTGDDHAFEAIEDPYRTRSIPHSRNFGRFAALHPARCISAGFIRFV